MNENWKTYLTDQGAELEATGTLHFGEPETEKTTALTDHVLADLSHYGLIRAEGEEVQDFLQNQFCNDVRKVDAGHSQLNGYCTPKGRLLALFRLLQREDAYLLRLPREVLEPTLKRLRMFVLRAKVTLNDSSDELVVIGYSGPDAETRLQAELGEIPHDADDVVHSKGVSVVRIPGPLARFELYGAEANIRGLWEKLSAQARPVGPDAWALLDIRAGLPEVVAANVEAFVPQMMNLEAVNALSFKKGCYPGQEIVARMQYLGKLKRRMYRAHAATDTCPQPGDALYAASSESGQGVGKVVQAQTLPDGGVELLAVIEIDSAENRALCLQDENGPALTLQPLPYEVAN